MINKYILAFITILWVVAAMHMKYSETKLKYESTLSTLRLVKSSYDTLFFGNNIVTLFNV